MWRSKFLVPSWSSLNTTSCVLVGLAFAALFGLIVWMIADVEMPLIVARWTKALHVT
jgi:hypothetical protein